MSQKSQLKVDRIVDVYGIGSPSLPYGAVIPPGGTLTVNGNIQTTGVSTIGSLESTSITATTITASAFVGDGSGLTGLPIVSDSKIIGLSLVF